MGGGGGGSQTTTSTTGLPKEFLPYYEKALGIATNRLDQQFDEQGNLVDPTAEGIVAGLASEQKEGLGAQTDLARQAVAGTGVYDTRAATERALQKLPGQQTAGMLGGLGSARGDRAMQAVLADKALDFQTLRQQQAEGGAQSLQDVGTVYQTQEQKVKDAPYTELQRYSNVAFGNAPQETTQVSSGGGGK